MKKVKRDSIGKADTSHELAGNGHRKPAAGSQRDTEADIDAAASASKTYRITTGDGHRIHLSPSVASKKRGSGYDPAARKFSGTTETGRAALSTGQPATARKASAYEETTSSVSLVPDARAKTSRSNDGLRLESSDQRSAGQATAKKPVQTDVRFSLAAPQVNSMFFDRRIPARPQSRAPADSVETVSMSDRTAKTPRAPAVVRGADMPAQVNPLLPKKSAPTNLTPTLSLQTPTRRDFSVSTNKFATGSLAKMASTARPTVRMFRREQVDTRKVIEEVERLAVLMREGRRERFLCSENVDVKAARINVQDPAFRKARVGEVLRRFGFEKKERVMGNVKEKVGKNKKMVQYEAKALKSTNTADVGSFRKDLRLVIEEKYDFFVHVDKIKEINRRRDLLYCPPTFKSNQAFD
jgi:hypothetical protein